MLSKACLVVGEFVIVDFLIFCSRGLVRFFSSFFFSFFFMGQSSFSLPQGSPKGILTNVKKEDSRGIKCISSGLTSLHW